MSHEFEAQDYYTNTSQHNRSNFINDRKIENQENEERPSEKG